MQSRQESFETIFVSTKEFLYGYIRKFITSDADTKDILQQCYIRLWMNMDTVTDLDNVLPLLYTYSKNLIVDTTRKKAREEKNMLGYTYFIGEAVDSIAPVEDKTSLQKLKKALQQIPERKRTIFLLRKEEGLSTREIAERLNIKPRAVRKHLEEAIVLLKMHLSSGELFALLMLNTSTLTILNTNI